ncbi:hypothetical protein P3T37_002043 [Kitasatospora sp. MAA4]|uniref:hypothetical protein n=1 Tax=Kitasatospora sp. MAA4 TaxID=3035093 RepID=UPI002474DF45|nr:hypothetical protein [Kitasatospora sp. MAA4]MDH6132657.1 hypothetical protein [Kitasatospora sp. MAA4]
MDVSTRPSRQSAVGLLEAAVGEGFAEALQQGLRRSVHARPAISTGAAAPRSASHRAAGPAVTAILAAEPPAAEAARRTAVLSPGEPAAILRRFESSLPRVLDGPTQDVVPLRRALLDYAGRVLAEAAAPGSTPAPSTEGLPADQLAAAGNLLLECALLQVLETAPATHEAGRLRSVGMVRALGNAMRRDADHRRDSGDADRSGPTRAPEHRSAQDTREQEWPELPPLREAIEGFAAQAAPAGLTVLVTVAGDERRMSEACRRELFLAVRHCLRTGFGRTRTGCVTVTVRVTRWWARAGLTDDGAGAEGPRTSGSRGQALGPVSERLERAGGRLEIKEIPGGGTRTTIHMPLRARP